MNTETRNDRPLNVQPGDHVRALDASGVWREKVAVSGIEGCYVDGKLTHDFVGVFLRSPDQPDSEGGIFWPLDDVKPDA